MATVTSPRTILVESKERRRSPGQTVVKWVTTTDHKVIGNLYFITSFIFFMIGGLLALLIRAELVEPGLQVVDNPEQFNQLFTMHGTIMLLLFATPLFAGFANALMPIQIGAPDVAFPSKAAFTAFNIFPSEYLEGQVRIRVALEHSDATLSAARALRK